MNKKAIIQIPVLIILVIILAYLFLYPSKQTQVLNVNLLETENRLIKISGIDIKYLNKPIIDTFSKSNPQGDFELDVLLINNNGDRLLSTTLHNIGVGESNFELQGNIKGTITIEAILHDNYGRPIDSKKKNVEIK